MIKISDTEYFSNDRTIRFLNMDCNEFMKGLKENEFDLNLSDPPYGIGLVMTKNGNRGIRTKKTENDILGWDMDSPSTECFNNIIRTSVNQILFGANNYISKIPFDTTCWVIWDCMNGDNYFADFQMAWTSFKTACRFIRTSQRFPKNEFSKKRIHDTEKPVELYQKIIQKYTNPTDTILDCFGGSMSNAIACHMERRKLTIIELDVDYFKRALNRFDFYERQLTLF